MLRQGLFLLAIALLCPCIASGEQAGSPAETGPATVPDAPETTSVRVFYLTNRNRIEDQPLADIYNGERGDAHFGHCEVEFSPIPIVNHVASRVPFYLQSETSVVALVEQAGSTLFWDQLGAAVERTSSRSVVLFVHGYNYGFGRTCRMAAKMQRSLQGQATVLAFSWPSNGLPSDYVSDQADIDWSVPLLASVIGELGDRLGRDRVQVVAHSMGSRGVIYALQQLGAGSPERPAIQQLMLLAPDFDSQTFVGMLPGLKSLAGSITLYASANDTPLKLSHQLSGYPRLGEAGDSLTIVEGMETIDVSTAGRYQFTGHEYFNFHPRVAADIVALLGTGTPASERPGLLEKVRDGIRYWEFE